MSDDEHITESELGTKDYWDDFYNNEITNFEDSGDSGETWFGQRNTHMIIDWIAKNCDKTASVCDLGCGNGYILSKLANRDFTNLVGMDYSPVAIDFCRKMYSTLEQTKAIQFEVIDILQNETAPIANYDVLVDKGTYDAICLMPDANIQLNREKYLNFVTKHLKVNGYFVIMSCNFTKDELFKFLLHNNAFQFIHEFETPKLSFGGKEGRQVTGLVMKVNQ